MVEAVEWLLKVLVLLLGFLKGVLGGCQGVAMQFLRCSECLLGHYHFSMLLMPIFIIHFTQYTTFLVSV